MIWKAQWDGEVRYSHGESDSSKIENERKDKNGCLLILKVTIQGSNSILINIYDAKTEQEQLTVLNQLDEFLDTIEINRGTQILLGGDLNFIHDLSPPQAGSRPACQGGEKNWLCV